MSWVAAGTAAVGIAGKTIGGSGTAGAAGASRASGDFMGGSMGGTSAGGIGDFNYNKPAVSQTTIWVIIGAIVAIFFIWRATAKK